MLDMDIQTLPPLRAAAIRHVGPFTELGPVFQRVCGWAGQKQLFGPDTRVLGVFHDDPTKTPAAELRSEAAVTVSDETEGDADAGVEIIEVAGGTYAVGILKGSYEQLVDAYTWMAHEWLPTTGRSFREGPCYEVYLNDATSTPSEELLTAIHVPLAD